MSKAASLRQLLVRLHRYIGLTLAPFLIVIAVTGSLIPYYNQLERAVNSKLRVVEPQGKPWTPRDLLVIRERLENQDPRSSVFSLQFPQRSDSALFSRVMGAIDPATGEPFELDYNEVFANPYTGERLGERAIGHFSLQPRDLVGQIFFLHYAFLFPAAVGMLIFGILGLFWAVEVLIGFYLTLPPASAANKKKPAADRATVFFKRWKLAWQFKWGVSSNRLIYESHRAIGLWLWALLLLFGVTGFALNLPQYYSRFMHTFTDYAHFQELPLRPPLEKPLLNPPVDWYQALELGERYMGEQARAQGFRVGKPAALEYRRDLGMYFYLAHTSRDLRHSYTPNETDSPATAATLALDARDGSYLGVQLPTGQRGSNTVTSWMIALHTTAIGGLPWQIAVSVFGLIVSTLIVTGVLVWWRKRKMRNPARTPAERLS
jgi:uncharacterized iron-regulated membrane protein